jgi:hypothetical protein
MSSANYEAWLKIGSGNQDLNWEGNRTLLMREQSEILPPGYEKIQDMWGGGAIASQITANTTSPIPGGAPFAQLYPQGNVTEFKDRWTWIDNNMLPDYKNLGDDYTKKLVNQPLEELAKGQFAPDPRPH